MTLAKLLLRLWKLRLWVALGGVLAVVAAVASVKLAHSPVYSSATTGMLVDSPQSVLGNAEIDLTGYVARADVFARLITSDEALGYIGRASGIRGNLIEATGPVETNGAPQATHAPSAVLGGPPAGATPQYKIDLTQNPQLPTIEVYTTAPTTKQAIALANGTVTGFAAFVSHVEARTAIKPNSRIIVRQLGGATGGVVDASAGKSRAVIIFMAVLALWSGLLLFVSSLRSQLRAERNRGSEEPRMTQGRRAIAVLEVRPTQLTSSATGFVPLLRRDMRARLPSGAPAGSGTATDEDQDHARRAAEPRP